MLHINNPIIPIPTFHSGCPRSLLFWLGTQNFSSAGMAIVSQKGDRAGVVGYRFCPTDDELVGFYLTRKNRGQHSDVRAISVIDVCKFEPWDLLGQSKIKSSDSDGYFFSPRDYKYNKSKSSNRSTDAGYWKSTGKPRKFMCKSGQIGIRRILVFYYGRPKGIRTGWVMHQYECAPDSNSHDEGNFVLCKLMRKSNEKTAEGQPNQRIVLASDSQTQNPTGMATNSFCDEHQPAHHMTYDTENLCPDDVAATLTDASGNTRCSTASDIENQMDMVLSDFMGGDFLSISDFENLHTCREGECPPMVTPTDSDQSDCLLVSDFKNQTSACGEVILPHTTMHFDSDNESPHFEGDSLMTSGYKKQISACGEGELPPLVISSDFRSELPYEKGNCLFTSDPKIQSLDFNFEEGAQNASVRAPSEGFLNTSYLGNQISDIESNVGQEISHISVPSWFEDQSKGEPNSLLAYDSRKINSDDKINISVSGEGESSSLNMTPSDFASQNQFQKIDMQNLKDDVWNSLMDFDVKTSNEELDPERVANLEAELQRILNSSGTQVC